MVLVGIGFGFGIQVLIFGLDLMRDLSSNACMLLSMRRLEGTFFRTR